MRRRFPISLMCVFAMLLICLVLFVYAFPTDKPDNSNQISATNTEPIDGQILIDGQVVAVYAPSDSSINSSESIDPVVATQKPIDSQNTADGVPVSRALVAKMAALIELDQTRISELPRTIEFSDTSVDKWYDRYINAAIAQGYMSGAGDVFMPEEALTLVQAQAVLDKISDGRVKIQLNTANSDKAISFALWTELYLRAINEAAGSDGAMKKFGIEQSEMIVLATPGNNNRIKPWRMITDKGLKGFNGLSMDEYIDKSINVLTKGDEVLALLSISDESPVLRNAYMVAAASGKATIFAGGAERTYTCDSTEGLYAGAICDININGRKAESINVYKEMTSGVIKKAGTDEIELEGGRAYTVDEFTRVYSVTDGAPRLKSLNELTIGSDVAVYVVNNGVVRAAIISGTTLPEKLRVVISTSGFKSLTHTGVTLTSDTDYTILNGGEETKVAAFEPFSISSENDFKNGSTRIFVKPCVQTGRIILSSIKRAYPGDAPPKYRGTIEISLDKDGFLVINELTLDEYLYAVVPSEMPTSYGVEAAKVQAIAARSFAYIQYYTNRFRQYGANMDDSIACQVYNNTPENEISIQAVDDTSGKCLTYNGVVISANYFAASCGMTANNGDVWASASGELPSETYPYLRALSQLTDGKTINDLSDEQSASAFLNDLNVKSFDSKAPWFRWNVSMNADAITRAVNKSLSARYAANQNLILTLDSDGVFKSKPISSVGQVKDLEVTKRGTGGNIVQLKITGDEKTVLVSGEYNIRVLLSPAQASGGGEIIIKRLNGEDVVNYSLLPSAFFVIEKTATGAKFIGGGCGHGVGMSQDGVKGMIDEKHTAIDILEHYYPGTIVRKMF